MPRRFSARLLLPSINVENRLPSPMPAPRIRHAFIHSSMTQLILATTFRSTNHIKTCTRRNHVFHKSNRTHRPYYDVPCSPPFSPSRIVWVFLKSGTCRRGTQGAEDDAQSVAGLVALVYPPIQSRGSNPAQPIRVSRLQPIPRDKPTRDTKELPPSFPPLPTKADTTHYPDPVSSPNPSVVSSRCPEEAGIHLVVSSNITLIGLAIKQRATHGHDASPSPLPGLHKPMLSRRRAKPLPHASTPSPMIQPTRQLATPLHPRRSPRPLYPSESCLPLQRPALCPELLKRSPLTISTTNYTTQEPP